MELEPNRGVMKIFTLPKRSLTVKKREGLFFILLMPGMLLGAIIVILPTIFDAMPYKEGALISIPKAWWFPFTIGLRSFMGAATIFFIWVLWGLIGILNKDGYIDALWEHSQKLKAEKEE